MKTQFLLDYALSIRVKQYINDICDKFDDVGSVDKNGTLTDSSNNGFKTRKDMFKESKWVYFCNKVKL